MGPLFRAVSYDVPKIMLCGPPPVERVQIDGPQHRLFEEAQGETARKMRKNLTG